VQVEVGNGSKRPVWVEKINVEKKRANKRREKNDDTSLSKNIIEDNYPVTTQSANCCEWVCVYTPNSHYCTLECPTDWYCDDWTPPDPPNEQYPGPGGGGSPTPPPSDSDNPDDLDSSEQISYPGKIDYATATASELAVHLLKAIKYCRQNNLSINLFDFFNNLQNHYHPGTHTTLHTSVTLDGVSIPLYIEIPHHGPTSGLVFRNNPGQSTDNADGKLTLTWGRDVMGINIVIQNVSHEGLVTEYLEL
jgi:hypothetical protein